MKLKFIFSFVMLLIITSFAASAQDSGITNAEAVATDEGIEFPSEIAAGYVEITITNNRSEAQYIPVFARLKDGVTMEDFMATMEADEMAVITMLDFYGGRAVDAGGSASFVINLPAGNYLLLETEGDGFASFTVTEGEMMDATLPEADVNMALLDFAVGVPAFVPAGNQTWHIENVGEQWHHVVVFKADEGTTPSLVREMIASESAEPEQVFYWEPMSAGVEIWTDIELEPGTYVVLCFLPDLAGDFSSHVEHGMIQVFVAE